MAKQHSQDMRGAFEAGKKAYAEEVPMNEPPYQLARLCLSWRFGWLSAWWEDVGDDD